MAYDEDLADRLRVIVGPEPGVEEKRMFGGLAFLLGGHLAVSASSRGGLLLRVDPARGDELAGEAGVEPFEMRGRPMAGWLHVSASAVPDDASLRRWVALGVDYVRTLMSERLTRRS